MPEICPRDISPNQRPGAKYLHFASLPLGSNRRQRHTAQHAHGHEQDYSKLGKMLRAFTGTPCIGLAGLRRGAATIEQVRTGRIMQISVRRGCPYRFDLGGGYREGCISFQNQAPQCLSRNEQTCKVE